MYQGLGTECATCHQADYDGTTEPVHSAAGFPVTCQYCHNTTTWDGATFDHSTQTQFPLTGAHLAVQCLSCHGGGVYQGLGTECATCHQTDYNGTTEPVHSAAGFPVTCQNCHNTSAWDGATFDHSTQTQFPLTGAHVAQQCQSCHGGGVYQGLGTECATCHQSDYDGTTEPVHSAAGFPVTCQNCHNTTTWDGATFDHDASFFPIYSGSHSGRWSDCTDCHTNNTNYTDFTCLSCHPHDDKSKTDGDHRGRSGYQYDSQACYSCHPRGSH